MDRSFYSNWVFIVADIFNISFNKNIIKKWFRFVFNHLFLKGLKVEGINVYCIWIKVDWQLRQTRSKYDLYVQGIKELIENRSKQRNERSPEHVSAH